MAHSKRALVLDQVSPESVSDRSLGGKLLGVRFLWHLERLLKQRPILTLLALQLVCSRVEERAPVPCILADTQFDPLYARVGLLAHGFRVC